MFKKILLAALLCAPLSVLAQKFGSYVHSDIMIAVPETKKAQEELNVLGQKYQTEITTMEKELQTKYEAYQKELNEQTPANIRERKEQEIMDLQQRIQQARQDNSAAFQKAQNEKIDPIVQKVVKAVNDVAAEGGYVFIIDEASASTAGMFLNAKFVEDVTNKVLAKLGITPAQAAAAKAEAQKAAQAAATAAQKK